MKPWRDQPWKPPWVLGLNHRSLQNFFKYKIPRARNALILKGFFTF